MVVSFNSAGRDGQPVSDGLVGEAVSDQLLKIPQDKIKLGVRNPISPKAKKAIMSIVSQFCEKERSKITAANSANSGIQKEPKDESTKPDSAKQDPFRNILRNSTIDEDEWMIAFRSFLWWFTYCFEDMPVVRDWIDSGAPTDSPVDFLTLEPIITTADFFQVTRILARVVYTHPASRLQDKSVSDES